VVGSESELSFTLPAAIRFGVELPPCERSGHGAERTRYSGRQRTFDQRERAIGP